MVLATSATPSFNRRILYFLQKHFCTSSGLIRSPFVSNTDFTNSWSSLHGARVSLQLSSSARIFAFGIRQPEIPTQCLDPLPTDFPPNAREPSSSRLHAAMTKIILIKSRITACPLSSVPHTLLATPHTRLPPRSLNLTPILFISRLARLASAPRPPCRRTPTPPDLLGMYGETISLQTTESRAQNIGRLQNRARDS
jgi:hypothetical protein